MKTTTKTNGTVTLHGPSGISGNLPAVALAGPSAPATITAPGATPILTTGKAGTDIPPLVVTFKGRNGRPLSARYYVAHPDDAAEAMEMGPDAAIEAGKAFPSITSCIGSLDKSGGLVPWATGLTADAAEEKLRELQDLDPVAIAEAIDGLLEPKEGDRNGRTVFNADLRQVPNQVRDTAANRGTEVHAICEALVHGEEVDVPEDLAGFVDAFLAFREEYPGLVYEYTEATVLGGGGVLGAGYMGTTDGIVTLNGKRYILDLKTKADKGKAPAAQASVGQQLAAAANADVIVYSDGRTEPMPKVDGGIAVVLDSAGRHAVYLFDTDADGDHWAGFQAARRAWDWGRKAGREPKPLKAGELLG